MKPYVAILFLVVSISGCKSIATSLRDALYTDPLVYKQDSIGPWIITRDTTIIHERSVPVIIPGSTVSTRFTKHQIDSIINHVKTLPAGSRIIYYTDSTLQSRLTFMLDSLGSVSIQCETLEKAYQQAIQDKERIIQQQRETVIHQNAGTWNSVLCLIIGILAGVMVIREKTRKR